MVSQRSRDLVKQLREVATEVKANREREAMKKSERIAQLERQVKRLTRKATAANKRADELEAIDRKQVNYEWEIKYREQQLDSQFVRQQHLIAAVRNMRSTYETNKILAQVSLLGIADRKTVFYIYHTGYATRHNTGNVFYLLDSRDQSVTKIGWDEMHRRCNDYNAHLIYLNANDPLFKKLEKDAK